jgi:hypothetical protein
VSQPSSAFRTPQWLKEQRDADLQLAIWLLGSNWLLMIGPRKKGRSSASRNFTDSGTLFDNISRSTIDHAWPDSGSSARTNGRKMKIV